MFDQPISVVFCLSSVSFIRLGTEKKMYIVLKLYKIIGFIKITMRRRLCLQICTVTASHLATFRFLRDNVINVA